MPISIVLLRGVNVGGRNKLPMASFAELLSQLGAADVQTVIQSGNAVVSAAKQLSPAAIAEALQTEHGFECPVQVWTRTKFLQAVDRNPFPDAVAEPKSLHLFFLQATPTKSAVAALTELCRNDEQIQVIGNVLYLHAPQGIARSKLAQAADRVLSVSTTARNWQTTMRIAKLLDPA